MSLSLLKIARPTFSLLGSDTTSGAVRARVVTRDEAALGIATPPGPGARVERSIEPMLAVYDARVETFRIVAAALARTLKFVVESTARATHSLRGRHADRIAIPE